MRIVCVCIVRVILHSLCMTPAIDFETKDSASVHYERCVNANNNRFIKMIL